MSAAASAAARRSTTRCCRTRSSSTSRWPGGRRSTRSRCSAGCATPTSSPGRPTGVLSPEEQLLLLKSWGGSTDPVSGPIVPSVQDVPLLDELRYAIGDVPARTDDERDLDETGLLEGGHDMQELLTASDREYAPSGRAWAPPTHRIEDDPFAHVLIDEAQDLTPMQWRMVGTPGADRVVDDRRRPRAVVVAGARRVGRGPRRGAGGQAGPRVPPLDQLPQQRGDLRVRGGVRAAGRARRRPADRRPVDRRRATGGRGRRGPRGRDPRGGPRRGRAR